MLRLCPNSPTAIPKHPSSEFADKHMKILVVEDDNKLARLLHQALEEEGYVVDTLEDGGDAIRRASSIEYDLIVLDCFAVLYQLSRH